MSIDINDINHVNQQRFISVWLNQSVIKDYQNKQADSMYFRTCI